MPRVSWVLIIGLVAALCWAGLAVAADESPIEAPTAADKALAARAIAAGEKGKGTMGQEYANFLLNDWPRNLVRQLAGEVTARRNGLIYARDTVTQMTEMLEQAPTWPQPGKVTAPFTSKAPVIDGKLDDDAWKTACVLTGAYKLNTKQLVTTPATTWRLTWDAQYLYMAAECADPDVIAPTLKRDGNIYNFDCVELFLMPSLAKMKYWELEVGATGSLFDSLNVKKADHWGGDMDNNAVVKGWQVATTVDGTANQAGDTDKGFIVEMAVPFSELPEFSADGKAKAGDSLLFIMARMDKNADEFTFYAHCPLIAWTHNVWNYATLELKK